MLKHPSLPDIRSSSIRDERNWKKSLFGNDELEKMSKDLLGDEFERLPNWIRADNLFLKLHIQGLRFEEK